MGPQLNNKADTDSMGPEYVMIHICDHTSLKK